MSEGAQQPAIFATPAIEGALRNAERLDSFADRLAERGEFLGSAQLLDDLLRTEFCMGHERVLQKLRNRRSTKHGYCALPRNGDEMNPGACSDDCRLIKLFQCWRTVIDTRRSAQGQRSRPPRITG